ncbi:MAG: hypothetical protein J6S82_00180 [Bacteroidales bacterium]|nr:hypothetical protein [Bacteroidales bacterium]
MKEKLLLVLVGLFALTAATYSQSVQKTHCGMQYCYDNDSLVANINRHEEFVQYKVSDEFPFSKSIYPEYGDMYVNIIVSQHFSYFSPKKNKNVCKNPTGFYAVMKWVNDSSLYVGELSLNEKSDHYDTTLYDMYHPLNEKNCSRFKTFTSSDVKACWGWMVAEMFRGNVVSFTLHETGKTYKFVCKSFYN